MPVFLQISNRPSLLMQKTRKIYESICPNDCLKITLISSSKDKATPL